MRATMTVAERYSRGAIAFHWAIAALVILNLALGIGQDAMPEGWQVMPVHKAIGVTVLVLTLARLGWRLAHPVPPLPAQLSGWQRAAAHLSHFLLYAFMVVMPLSGWAMVSGAKRRPLEWFGLFDIPYLPIPPGLADVGRGLHGLLGWGFAALIAVHIGAALRHHFLLRDNVLVRMLPGVSTPGPRG